MDAPHQNQDEARDPFLSFVVPFYDEEAVLASFHERLGRVIDGLALRAEILYVDDGSRDRSVEILRGLPVGKSLVRILSLSRNFGKEIALTAGLDHARGDAVVVIDADLQDPPELVPELVGGWREGYDVVYARRRQREGETFAKKATAKAFYRIMRRLGGRVAIPEDTGDFRLMSRRAVDAVRQLREHHRFMKGLFAWVGFRQKAVSYDRDPRFAGETKWSYWKLWNLSLEGITSFSTAPLRLASYVGMATASFAFGYGLYIIFKALLFGDPVAGFPSLIAVITFLGGIQLLTMGVLGEYLGRTFNEVKDRPLYFVLEEIRSGPASPESDGEPQSGSGEGAS